MLDARQRFKLGFITRCIEDGITTPDEICQRAKEAADRLGALPDQQLEKVASGLWDTISNAGLLAVSGALAAPPIIGGAAGYGLSRMSDVDEDDVEEAKRQELIDELQRQATKLKRHQRFRASGKAKGTTASLF
jgi:hypothetical protein